MSEKTVYTFILYYKKDAKYHEKVASISKILKEVTEKWSVLSSFVETDSLKTLDIEKFKSDIRSVLPQVRGKIVSSKGFVLPLSGSKNPNFKNTSVLILYRDDIPVNVFPHLLGTSYFDIEDAVRGILKFGPREYLGSKGLLEDPIVKIVSNHPSIVELGMRFIDTNVETEVGEIDLLLEDSDGRKVVVEVETKANDFAVGQVCRLATGYSEKMNLKFEELRRMIICITYDKNVQKTCKGADVELFQITVKQLN